MGRKLEETFLHNETVAEQSPTSSEIKAEKKKNKKKKHKQPKIALDEVEEIESKENADRIIEEDTEANRKRKLEETPTVAEPKKKKKEKKKKKGKDGEEGLKVEDDRERKEVSVVVTGKDAEESKYSAFKSFAESKLPDNVLRCCSDFSEPSPIQSHAWPFLLDGRDFIGIAATGSGKTLAFGIPAMMHVLNKRKKTTAKGVIPLCLVLSPTRELAQQIWDVLSKAGQHCGVKSVCLHGGTCKGPQISSLKSGVDIVIGTPGRLKDLIEMDVCCLTEVSFVVLDEADRMLDLGFEPEVRSILSKTSPARQIVMFSATWPQPVHRLAQEFMDLNPVKVVIGSEDLAANHDVMQIVEVLDDRSRDERLLTLLRKYHNPQRNRVLVFVLYKKEAERVENMIKRRGWKVVSCHGDKAQAEREKALSSFMEGSCPLLIATDLVGRGIDTDVEVVINYSFPLTTEAYVHRIGRTGRAGKKGIAHTFFMQENKGLAGELVNVLKEAGQNVPTDLLKFGTHVKKKESKLYGAHFREIAPDAPKSKKITFDNSDED